MNMQKLWFLNGQTNANILKDKKVEEAREIVITWLEKNNLLEKTEHIKQNVPTSERTNAIIEPLPKLQWWVNVNKTFKINSKNIC